MIMIHGRFTRLLKNRLVKKVSLFLLCCISAAGIWYYAYIALTDDSTTLSIPKIPFYFIRHGQTDYNIKKLIGGKTDTPLNKMGITQARAAAHILENTDIQTIVTSPLHRAHKTAEIIAEKLHKPIIIMNEFAERSAGDFEGKPEKWWLLPKLDGWLNGLVSIPNAEDYNSFKERITHGLQKALQLPGPVLIVAHGIVFEMIETILKLHPHMHIENATPVFIAPNEPKNAAWHYKYLSMA